MSFKSIRIAILLALLTLAWGTNWWEQRTVRAWEKPLQVVVYPMNGDGSAVADEYVRALRLNDFADIDRFLTREARKYGVKFEPAVQFSLGKVLTPPPLPDGRHSILDTVLWSLKLRWWVYRNTSGLWPKLGWVKVFVLYHAPQEGVALAHSLGLQKGLIGVVHAFADPRQTAQNNIVIAHELLHTLGATDKYDAEGRPVYPIGYAEPGLPPDVPRHEAEVMAGRIALADGRNVMPASLDQCVIGAATAYEINFGEAFSRNYAGG